MSFGIFSRRVNSSSSHRQPGRRVLRLERLENRQMLSIGPPTITQVTVDTAHQAITWNAADLDGVKSSSLTIDGTPTTNIYGPYTAPPGVNYAGVFGGLASGTHTYVITATDNLDNSSQVTDTFDAVGPTISRVVVDTVQRVITWNAADVVGVASSTLKIDGVNIAQVYGPFVDPPGVDFAGVFGRLSVGTHTYVITATNYLGNSSPYTDTFSLAGPTISGVVVDPAQGNITWHADAVGGVQNTILAIDGTIAATVFGPYPNPPGADYSGVFGILPVGHHSYVITANGNNGFSTQATGTFDGTGPAIVGPTISHVVVNQAQSVVSWHVADTDGSITTTSLAIDGTPVVPVFGPYQNYPGADYSAVYKSLATGVHAYVISASDSAGHSAQSNGSFQLGPIISSVIVSPTQGVITWNAVDPIALSSETLTVDGTSVTNIFGPFTAAAGSNFSGVFGLLAGGSHTYTITSTDTSGFSSQYSGTFSVGAVISQVTLALPQQLITWNALAAAGVASAALNVDGQSVANVSGPFAAASGVNFAGVFGSLSLGIHNYVITVLDNTGISSQFASTLTIPS